MAVNLADVMNSSGIDGIAESMVKAELYANLYTQMFLYPMNNFLHNHINNVFTYIMKNQIFKPYLIILHLIVNLNTIVWMKLTQNYWQHLIS